MKKILVLSIFLLCVLSTTYLKAQTYCITNLYSNGCTYGDYLTDFNFSTINQIGLSCPNSSGDTIAYNDYTFDSINLIRGNNYTISGILGSSPDDYVRVWIDFNDDGTFNDTTELIYQSEDISGTTFSGNAIIPANSTLGIHRMRVRVVYNYPPINFSFDACTIYDYGCTNDYTVNIISVTTPYITVSPTTYNFNYVAYGNSSPYQEFDVTGKNLSGVPDSISVIVPNGYQISLATDSGYGSSVVIPYTDDTLASTPVYVMFIPTAANTDYTANIMISGGGASSIVPISGTSLFQYCVGGLYFQGCNFGDYLTAFNFGSINQTGLTCPASTGDTIAYNDYTSHSTNVMQGNTYTISGVLGNSPFEYIRVWIDYNDDVIFNDTNELVYNSGDLSTTTFNGNITIPVTAPLGTHRMRVRVVYDLNNFDACSQYANGCVNDYLVNVIKHGPDVGVTSITVPDNLVAIGSVINPAITIHNFGDTVLTSFPIAYSINNGFAVVEYNADTLQPGETIPYIFTTPFTVPDSSFNICAWATTSGDVNTQNDTTCNTVAVAFTHDVGVSKIIDPADSAQVNSVHYVQVMIKNNGLSTETNIPVSYQVNSLLPFTETWTGSLAYNDSVVYTFVDSLTIPTGVSFSLCAWTYLPTDQDTANDKTCKTVVITSPNGINEITANNIKLSPNPAHDKLNINCNFINKGATQFTIYDIEGKKLYIEETYITTASYNKVINVSNLKAGLYFLKIENDSGYVNNKFVIE